MNTCDVCMKKTNGKRYCRDCERNQKAMNAKPPLHPRVRDWTALTQQEKLAMMKTPEWRSRLSPDAKRQYWREFAVQLVVAVGVVAGVVAFIANGQQQTSVVQPSAAQTSDPIRPSEPVALVAGAEEELWTYLNDNFQGTDWFLWVDSTNYYVDGPVRVMDLNLNGFVSTDQDAAKSIAQSACIAVYSLWIDQERNGTRAFEVLYIGDSSGNIYRREDYAGGEKCLGE